MLLEGRSRNINARRRSRTAYIFVSARQYIVLISDNSPVRKNYFDSNIVWNINVRIMQRFSMDYFGADVERSICLHATSSRREM